MLLTCPKCALSYAIDETQLGPQGRTVRCASCKTTWHAEKPDEPIDLPLEKAVEKPAAELKDVKAKKIPSLYRDMIESKKRHKALMAQGMIWSALAVTFLVLLGGAWLMRVDVVRAMPRLAGAYAAVGVPVNAAGIDVMSTKFEKVLRGGRFAIVVTAEVKNIRDEETPVPPLRVTMLDSHGQEIDQILVPPQGLTVAAHETRTIVFDVPDPKNLATQLNMQFDLQAMKDMQRLRPSMLKGQGDAKGNGHGTGHDTGKAGTDEAHAKAADAHATPAAAHAAPAADHAPEVGHAQPDEHASAHRLAQLPPAQGADDAGHGDGHH